MREEYETFGLATIRQLRNLVRSKTSTENAINEFKKDLMEVCNEELDRLYDNKKTLKMAGVGVAGAAVAAPLIAIPPLLGAAAAAAAAAPTALFVTSGATTFGVGGGALGAGAGAAADKLIGERIYVGELNESHDGEESRDALVDLKEPPLRTSDQPNENMKTSWTFGQIRFVLTRGSTKLIIKGKVRSSWMFLKKVILWLCLLFQCRVDES